MIVRVSVLEAVVALGLLNPNVLEVEEHHVEEELDHLLDRNPNHCHHGNVEED